VFEGAPCPSYLPMSFLSWGNERESVPPLPATMVTLRKLKVEFGKIPEVIVQKSIMHMKKRGALVVRVKGQQVEDCRQAVEE
jgi:hypothetical protein